jgi:hypothetical protein
MAKLTLPSPAVPIGMGKCPHCGAAVEVKIDKTWFEKLSTLLKLVNAGL